MPMMAFIGVRISWLMLARNIDLARADSSAKRVAFSSSRRVCASRVMPSWMLYVGFALLFVGGILGALLGHKMLKKHFERAGIV